MTETLNGIEWTYEVEDVTAEITGIPKDTAGANYFTAQYLTPMRKAGYIAQVGEANPHSPRQKYRITAKGRREIANG